MRRQVSDKEALEAYFKKRPDPSIEYDPGPVRSVDCHRSGMTFRGVHVYECDMYYAGGDIGGVCGARIDGRIVTTGFPRNCIP